MLVDEGSLALLDDAAVVGALGLLALGCVTKTLEMGTFVVVVVAIDDVVVVVVLVARAGVVVDGSGVVGVVGDCMMTVLLGLFVCLICSVLFGCGSNNCCSLFIRAVWWLLQNFGEILGHGCVRIWDFEGRLRVLPAELKC